MDEFKCPACGKDSFCKEKEIFVCKFCGSRFGENGSPLLVMPDAFVRHMSAADEYEEEHKTVREVYSLMEALEIWPGNVAALVKMGMAYRDSNLLDRALECYDNAIKSDPLYAQAYINSGVILTAKLNFTKACENFEKALELIDEEDSDYSVVLANYAFASAKNGEHEKAVMLLSKADENGYQGCETIRKTVGITLDELEEYKRKEEPEE